MAMVAQAFAEILVGKLTTFVGDEMSMLLGVNNEVTRLQRRLERLRGFLEYAEQTRYPDPRIDILGRELKDVMYDADDILDICMIEGGRLLKVNRPTLVVRSAFTMLSSFFICLKYRHRIGVSIMEVNDRLDEIGRDNQIINLGHKNGNFVRVSLPVVSTSQSCIMQDAMNVVGNQIEYDADKLITCIVESNEEKCRFFAITGMTGIGKTTLARKIFNDERITHNFPDLKFSNDGAKTYNFSKRRIWLYVSRNYSATEMLKEMVRNLGGSDGGEKSIEELATKLASLLPKSLFLVLDNIWSDDVWYNLLQGLMIRGETKWRVLVTTRDESVARSLKAPIHHVKRMDKDSCWELLCKEVFMEGEKDGVPHLSKIGAKIVKKCDGLPLAIKAVAGILRGKNKNETEWKRVLTSQMWSCVTQMDGLVPRALYLSYKHLPPIVKQCFLYCSLIASNGKMYREDLVRYWIDEGFIITNEDRNMEDMAEDCYRELMWRNMLQPEPDPSYLDGSVCTMHDLLQSLGQFLIQGEAMCIEEEGERVRTRPLIKLRRLMIKSTIGETLEFPRGMTKHLRALFVYEGAQIKSIENSFLKDQLCNLRILMLRGLRIEKLPHSIGHLVHLRHLDLDGTNIKKIPNQIGRLVNLQTLRAGGCQFLQQLPKTITRLQELRLLNVEDTPLSHVPMGIGQLKKLNEVRGLVIGHDGRLSRKKERGFDLDELQPLSNIKALGLHMLQRSSFRRATSALANKRFLRELLLSEAPYVEVQGEQATTLSAERILSIENIYNDLSPPSSIQTLRILNFPGGRLPIWMMSDSLGDSFPNLTTLVLWNATSCNELPPQLSQLPSLKYLRIRKFDAIVIIGDLFFARGSKDFAFPSLEYLSFGKMLNWEVWGSDGSANMKQLLPSLRKLVIDDCPKLKALPKCLSLAPNLQKVWIARTCDLETINNLPRLSDEMFVVECQRLKTLSNLRSLRHLTIDNCPSLESVENLTLEDLFLETFEKHLPPWLSPLVLQQCLKKFEMRCTMELLKDCLRNGPNWHVIAQIPCVSIQSFDKSVYMNCTKNPESYQTNAKTEDQSSCS